jgi:hypothetical protein
MEKKFVDPFMLCQYELVGYETKANSSLITDRNGAQT